ncbi:hypothetical protein FACS1894205_0870 [Alphaproteobacteria bacterium]|nr:hypothetical protein FACS1894205_0870 [Alphaproteobacteria bacterium]
MEKALLWAFFVLLALAVTAAAWAFRRYARVGEDIEKLISSLSGGEQVGLLRSPGVKKLADIFDEAERRRNRERQANQRFWLQASHDLRQPMQALGLFILVLSSQDLSSKQKAALDKMEESLTALGSLVDALLDLSRLDAGTVEAHPEAFRPEAVFGRLEEEFALAALQKGLSLRFSTGSYPVMGDEAMVLRILRIMLSNAIRFTKKGGIVVGAKKRGNRVLLGVWDSGIGVPDEKRDQVFLEFSPLARESDGQGAGLGLAIATRLAKATGGAIEWRTSPSRGSMFGVTLPIKGDGIGNNRTP